MKTKLTHLALGLLLGAFIASTSTTHGAGPVKVNVENFKRAESDKGLGCQHHRKSCVAYRP